MGLSVNPRFGACHDVGRVIAITRRFAGSLYSGLSALFRVEENVLRLAPIRRLPLVGENYSSMEKANTKAKSKKPAFSKGDFVVYPTHGVGEVTGVATEEIAGFELKLFVIKFAAEKMTLRVPVGKIEESGLRKVSSKEKMATAINKLKGRARAKRSMWSRRAQEYEAKINSGDPISIAEVVRDLHRAPDQPDQSYSERQMYEAAINRLSHELEVVEKIDAETAAERLQTLLIKPPVVKPTQDG